MTQELYKTEEQAKDLNVKNLSVSETVNQEKGDDIVKTDSSPDPRFIAFVVLISAALLFVASIYYGIINP